MKHLANLFTVLSLFCGFVSVILSLRGEFSASAYVIILSVILDGLDGQVARRHNLASDFGKEMDSLVDVVSFGFAPVLLGYSFISGQFYILSEAVLFVFLLCAIIRLARYNVLPTGQGGYFIGLPTTIAGGVFASLIIIYMEKWGEALPGVMPLFLLQVFILSCLMVSNIRYLAFDGILTFPRKILRFAIFILFILLCFTIYWDKIGELLFCVFLIYLIFSPFVVKRLNSK